MYRPICSQTPRAIVTGSGGNQTVSFPSQFNSLDTANVVLMQPFATVPNPVAISMFL